MTNKTTTLKGNWRRPSYSLRTLLAGLALLSAAHAPFPGVDNKITRVKQDFLGLVTDSRGREISHYEKISFTSSSLLGEGKSEEFEFANTGSFVSYRQSWEPSFWERQYRSLIEGGFTSERIMHGHKRHYQEAGFCSIDKGHSWQEHRAIQQRAAEVWAEYGSTQEKQ